MTIKKGIQVHSTLKLPHRFQDKETFQNEFPPKFQQANAKHPLKLQLKSCSVTHHEDDNRNTVWAEILGEQEPAGCFGDPAKKALALALELLLQPVGDTFLAARRPSWKDLLERTEIAEDDYPPEQLRLIHRTPAQLRKLQRPVTYDFRERGIAPRSIEEVGPTADKPAPRTDDSLRGCPSVPCDGDHDLDVHKNRRDKADEWIPVIFESILNLAVPDGVAGPRKDRSKWTDAQRREVALYEGTPVQVQGWIIDARHESHESCNCCSLEDVDYHVWMVGSEHDLESPERSIVIEITPWVRDRNPQFTLDRIRALKGTKKRLPTMVQISGWLMLDQKHPDHVGDSRGSIWEIHPVMDIMVYKKDKWQPL